MSSNFTLRFPKIGDEIVVDDDIRTLTKLDKNSSGDPIIGWESTHERGTCMLAIWLEWEKYSKLEKKLPTSRRSDIYE